MIPTALQSQKAALVFAQLLSAYKKGPPQAKIEKMQKALESQLPTLEISMFGRVDAPDVVLNAALKKAGIAASEVKDVILVSFERDDKIRYWFQGGWYER